MLSNAETPMRVALEQARIAAACGEVPVGAVILHEGEIIAAAGNRKESAVDPVGHAEILVLREAAKKLGRWRLLGCTLVVTLEPCPMCAFAMVLARIDCLVFAAPDPRTGAAGSVLDLLRDPRFNHRMDVVSGVLSNEASQLLKDFFVARRKSATILASNHINSLPKNF
jgi:tRNA(adenine34) deaminase